MGLYAATTYVDMWKPQGLPVAFLKASGATKAGPLSIWKRSSPQNHSKSKDKRFQ